MSTWCCMEEVEKTMKATNYVPSRGLHSCKPRPVDDPKEPLISEIRWSNSSDESEREGEGKVINSSCKQQHRREVHSGGGEDGADSTDWNRLLSICQVARPVGACHDTWEIITSISIADCFSDKDIWPAHQTCFKMLPNGGFVTSLTSSVRLTYTANSWLGALGCTCDVGQKTRKSNEQSTKNVESVCLAVTVHLEPGTVRIALAGVSTDDKSPNLKSSSVDVNATENEDQHILTSLSNDQESHHPIEEPLPEARDDEYKDTEGFQGFPPDEPLNAKERSRKD
uniref:Uncharacterized protein n=1 Tax=Timema bartmani TaxID=61472 RepID=A0A7R9EVI4_9NEOP|nr:unnamed protein product [Timema bartmani]